MRYYTRLAHQTSPANKLQADVIDVFRSAAGFIHDDINSLESMITRLSQAVEQINSNHKKCKPVAMKRFNPAESISIYIEKPGQDSTLVMLECHAANN